MISLILMAARPEIIGIPIVTFIAISEMIVEAGFIHLLTRN